MEYDHDHQVTNFITGLLLGAVIGAGVALLSAPESGYRTRRRIRRVAGDIRTNANDRWDELAEEVKERVDDALKGVRKRIG